MPRKFESIVIYIAGLATGFCIFYVSTYSTRHGEPAVAERRQGAYNLINPLLDCSAKNPSATTLGYPHFDIKGKLATLIETQTRGKHIQNMSVYFRDLTDGSTFGINDELPFQPGSLRKLPLAMGYFKRSEGEQILDKSIPLRDPKMLQLYDIQSPVKAALKAGESYRVDFLLKALLTTSDNVAASLLEAFDNRKSLIRAATDLNIPVHSSIPPFRQYSLGDYAGVFGVLYNATYLNREDSSQMLKLLSESDFREGLRAGISNDIVIAHKFGEALDTNAANVHYLNDCGIVYLPNRPYLLCIATKGTDPAEQGLAIREASQIAFNEMQTFFNTGN